MPDLVEKSIPGNRGLPQVDYADVAVARPAHHVTDVSARVLQLHPQHPLPLLVLPERVHRRRASVRHASVVQPRGPVGKAGAQEGGVRG